jgi:probable HAF family extracellular repeat protein
MVGSAQQLSSWFGRSFTTLDPTGSILTIAYDIQNSELITGFYVDEAGRGHGFLTSSGVYQNFEDAAAGPVGTYAQRVNDAGQIVGVYVDPSGVNHSFMSVEGIFYEVSFPQYGGGETDVWDINNAGTIVGLYFDSVHTAHGFVLNDGVYTTLDDPLAGQRGTMSIGINDLGVVVGHYYDGNGNAHGFLESDGQYVTIDDPLAGPRGTFPKEINNHGQVVGVYYDKDGMQHAFIYAADSYLTVDNPLGTEGTLAYGINDFGQIVGYFKDDAGNAHGFMSGPMEVDVEDIQSANETILRTSIDNAAALSLSEAINSGSIIAANYLAGLARTAADTTSAVLSVFEFMGLHPDSLTLDEQTHFISNTNSQVGTANGWVELGAAIAELSPAFTVDFGDLDSDDFINKVTSAVFGTSDNSSQLQFELNVYRSYFGRGLEEADPAVELRARGAFAADMLHQASDYAALHPESQSAAFRAAAEAFLVGLVEGTKHIDQSIFL